MLSSWLLPNILLNNEIGQLPKEACIRIIPQLEGRGNHQENCNARSNPSVWTDDPSDHRWETFLNDQAWNGGIYSSQLHERMLESGPRRRRSLGLVVLAVTSVCISFSIAFGVLYSYPTFFSCRNVMFIGITVTWLSSPVLTRAIMTFSIFGKSLKSKWRTLILKDGLIAFSIVLTLILSSCVVGNSCRCWAGFNNKIKGVVLNPAKQFTQNNTYIYPILIATCLILQYFVFKTALYVGRTGLGIMTWSSEDRRNSLPGRAAAAVQEDEVTTKALFTIEVDALDSVSKGRAMLPGDIGFESGRYGSGLSG